MKILICLIITILVLWGIINIGILYNWFFCCTPKERTKGFFGVYEFSFFIEAYILLTLMVIIGYIFYGIYLIIDK